MKQNNPPTPARLIAVLSLVFSLSGSIVIADNNVLVRRAEAKTSGNAKGKKVSPDLKKDGSLVRVILQLDGKPSGRLNALLNRNGVHLRASFKNLNAHVVELPGNVVDELANFSEVAFVSPDRKMSAAGHLTAATGALAV